MYPLIDKKDPGEYAGNGLIFDILYIRIESNMPNTINLRVQRSVFDLDAFEDVTLVKEFEHQEVDSVQEALARVANNQEKLLSIINEGLRAEARRKEANSADGWRTFTDEGDVNGIFSGTIADPKAVNALVLTLAKTVFGYSKDMSNDQKRAAKASAESMIKNTQAIRDGLKKSAALGSSNSTDSAEVAENA